MKPFIFCLFLFLTLMALVMSGPIGIIVIVLYVLIFECEILKGPSQE